MKFITIKKATMKTSSSKTLFLVSLMCYLFNTNFCVKAATASIISAPMEIVSITSFGTDTVIAAGGYKYNPVSGWPGDYSYLLRSIDGGQSWKVIYRLHSTAQFHCVYALNNSTGFAVADSGLMYKTLDAGASWFRVTLPSGINLYNIEFKDSLTGYATGSQERYLKTVDGGYTWTQKAVAGSYNGLYDITWTSATKGFICGEMFYATNNGGSSWNAINNFSGFIKTKMHWKNSLEGFMAPFSGGLGKTTNGGLSWTVDTTANFIDLFELDSTHFIGVKDNQVYETVDTGNTWTLKYSLPLVSGSYAQAVHFSTSLKGWIGCANEIYFTNDGGVTWSLSGYQLGYVPNLIAFDSLTLYAFTGSTGNFICRTLDGGASWRYPVINAPFSVNDVDFISPAYGFASSATGLYLTVDSGYTWSLINAFPIAELNAFNQNNLVAYDLTANHNLITSTDGGVNWNTIQPSVYYPAIKKVDNNVAFAKTDLNLIYRTIDGGLTWQNRNNNNVNFIKWDMHDSLNGVGRLSSAADIYTTTDGAHTWNYKSTNTNLYDVKMIDPQTIIDLNGLRSYYLSQDSGITFTTVPSELTTYVSKLTRSNTGEIIFYGDIITGNFLNGFSLCATSASYYKPYNGIFEQDSELLQNQSVNANQFQWSENGSFMSTANDYNFLGVDTGINTICLRASDGTCNADYCNSVYVHPFGSIWLQRTGRDFRQLRFTGNFQIGNYGYRCGGWLNNVASDSCFRLNLNTLTWQPIAKLPVIVQNTNMGFAIGNYGYVLLGDSGVNGNKELWRYNSSNNTWIQKTSFPGNARSGSGVFVINNKAYIMCGFTTNPITYLNECWEYDAVTDMWAQRTSFPGTVRMRGAAFAINGFGFYGGGFNGTFFFDYYKYDVTNDSWSAIPSFPNNQSLYEPQTCVRGNYCYIINAQNVVHSNVQRYNIISNSWDSVVSINANLQGGVCFLNGDSILSCHGNLSVSPDSTIWYMRLAPNSIPVSTMEITENNFDVSIYPNPAKENFSIYSTHLKINAVEVYNLMGEKMIAEKTNSNSVYINTSKFSQGVYLVLCSTDKGIINKKIIITKTN